MERSATLPGPHDPAQHRYAVIYSHNHEKVSVPLKSQVFEATRLTGHDR